MRLRALDRKLLRDLWRLRLQVAAIALLIACGVSVAVMAFSAKEALQTAQTDYYAQNRFADVFAGVRRAPLSAARDLARIDGVVAVDARAMKAGLMRIPGQVRPGVARLIALPDDDAAALNRLVLTRGRMPGPDRSDEAVALKTFLDAAGISLNERVSMVIDGRQLSFVIVGAALSPEFVYVPSPASSLPDDAHQGVFWARRFVVERATGLGGAFSTVALKLAAGASEPAVLAAVDRILTPYGGEPAYGREDQVSNRFQDEHIEQLGLMAWVMPPVFLAVAAGLVNMVLGRMVETEREQIGLLKAFGYGDLEASTVYLKMALLIGLTGAVAGGAFGGWLGGVITRLFAQYMRFPHLETQFSWAAFLVAAGVSAGAALVGSLRAVRKAAALSPAVAMQPPAPTVFRKGLVERLSLWRRLDQPTRMIVRRLERAPGRAALTALGLAASLSLLVGSQFVFGSLDEIIDQAYYRARRWSDLVSFAEPRDARALAAVSRLPGVLTAEPVRFVSIRVRAQGREEKAFLSGLEPDAILDRTLDDKDRGLPFRGGRLILSDALAARLRVRAGDPVEVQLVEGRRPRVLLPVDAISRDYFGLAAVMDRAALNRLLGDGDLASGAHLRVAADRRTAFYDALLQTPQIVGAASRDDTVAQFRETEERTLRIEAGFYLGFAAAIAFGVAYNISRIALADHGRDLATLRVLGFDQGECAYILLGELGILALAAIPPGLGGGFGVAEGLTAAFSQQDMRLPLVTSASSYGVSISAFLGAVVIAAGLVGGRIWTLDLVAVLKTRE